MEAFNHALDLVDCPLHCSDAQRYSKQSSTFCDLFIISIFLYIQNCRNSSSTSSDSQHTGGSLRPPTPTLTENSLWWLVVIAHCQSDLCFLPLRPPCGPLHTLILGMTCDSRPLKQTWVTSARKLRKNSISHWFLPSHTDTHNSSPRRLLQLPSWDSYSVSQCRKSVSESPVRVADVQCLLIDSQCALSGRITLPIVRHSSIFIYNHSVSHQYGLQIFNAFGTVYAFSRPSVAEIPCQL